MSPIVNTQLRYMEVDFIKLTTENHVGISGSDNEAAS
jgi:hypothetical protein